MDIVPLTPDHIESPMWDSSDEYERMHARLHWHLHTPYANAIAAIVYEEVAGIGAVTRFGESARITVCKLVGGHNTVAVRTALVNTLLEELTAAGCTSITVTVPPDQVPHWEALEFVAQEPLLCYSGGRFFEGTYPDVVWIEPQHRMAVMRMDRQASGEDRTQLLLEHEYIGRAYLEGNAVRGFALALLGHALIVADSAQVGLELQRYIFPTQEHLLIPEGNTAAHAHLLERGYTAEVVGVRMVRGEERAQRTANIYGEPYGPI